VPRATYKVSLGMRMLWQVAGGMISREGLHECNYCYNLNKESVQISNPKTTAWKELLARRTLYALHDHTDPIGLQDVKYNRNWMGAAATTTPLVRKPGKSISWRGS